MLIKKVRSLHLLRKGNMGYIVRLEGFSFLTKLQSERLYNIVGQKSCGTANIGSSCTSFRMVYLT
jgi:hypothetical protein